MEFSFTEEQIAFKKDVMRFAREKLAPRAQKSDLEERFDTEAFRMLGEYGILGLHFPEELGGSDADVVTTVLAGEALGEAGADGGLMLAYGAHTFLCADTIFKNGTDAQREKFVPKLASGEWIGCMGLTEPNAGSDVASMKATAKKQDGCYVLNGSKMFITNGPVADVAVVYAKTNPDLTHAGISAFIVEKGTKGFSAGPPLIKLGVRGSATSELILEDCEIPEENLLGMEGMGFMMALQTVEWDRSALLAPFIGAGTYVLQKCADYANTREQFGRPIAKFQGIKHKLANIRIFTEAARTLCYRVAWCKDQGRPLNHLEAAIAKLFVGDWSLEPLNDAMLLHGGYGYCHEYDVERIFRDGRLAPIGGGTSDIQKTIISKLM